MPKLSVKSAVQDAQREDKRARTFDSFQNFAAKMGVGTDNLTSGGTYGFNPISRVRILLEWIYRGSWVGGNAVDIVADDMTRSGVKLLGDVKPKDIEKINEAVTGLRVWESTNDNISWARLYGGSIMVYLLEGQKFDTPLRVETVGKGMFKGLCVLDRWMVEPSLNDLVTEFGPNLGMPKFYTVQSNAPALRGMKIHYSRVMRLEGVKLPYQQRLMENLWGISVLERLYDRMIAFDSATQGAAQLVYKSYIRTLAMKDFRENVAAGGPSMDGVIQAVQMMARFQSIEGISIIDSEDVMTEGGATNFGGISEALTHFGQQLAGALGIPLTRFLGLSATGFNSGDADIRGYYDTVNQWQNNTVKIPMTTIYRCIAASEGIILRDGFGLQFNPLWQLTESEKAGIFVQVSQSLSDLRERGVLKPETALKELKQSSETTGYGTNITDEDIKDAEEEGPPLANNVEAVEAKDAATPGSKKPLAGEDDGSTANRPQLVKKTGTQDRAFDTMSNAALLYYHHGLQMIVENPSGSVRRGYDWQVTMPADYGYLMGAEGADGDAVDCFLGMYPESDTAYVIDQRNLDTGDFDEHKVMLGYRSVDEALEDYDLAYQDGLAKSRIMGVSELSMPELREWLSEPEHTVAFQKRVVSRIQDAAFKESEHPRRDDGEFAPKGSDGKAYGKDNPAPLTPRPLKAGFMKAPADRKNWPSYAKHWVVPPGWRDVHITKDPKSALLATGKDFKNRVQPLYSAAHKAKKSAAKFKRIGNMPKDAPRIMARVIKDRNSSNEQIKANADVAHLIMATGLRPGSDTGTGADKQAYGATTLLGEHVVPKRDGTVELHFVGKKGVDLKIPVTDKGLSRMLKERAALSQSDGKLFPETNSGKLLRYVKSMSSGKYKTKDFRTLMGTNLAMSEMQRYKKAPSTLKEYKAMTKEIATVVSQKLGNTPAVAMESYIAPETWAAWRESANVE